MKPFLKWAGGKYRIIDKINASLPKGGRLIEPFAGSGAVFLNTTYEKYLIADANADVINVFQCVQKDGLDFISYAKELFITGNNQEEKFYMLREEFNRTNDIHRKAAIFIYLNRHCFNGLCRYNSKGGFNVPFGRYKSPTLPEAEMINFFHKSQSVEFKVADFLETMSQAKVGDVVYCDPPYVPLTLTSNFTSYTQDGFSLDDQRQLADMANNLMSKGIPVIISNHDTEFTRDIYSSAQKIDAFDVQRFISSDASNRNKASELLAVFSLNQDSIMMAGGVGGGNTITGLAFEAKADLETMLCSIDGYTVGKVHNKAGRGVFFHGELLARCFKKHDFYQYLAEEGIDWIPLISKKLLPDNALLVIVRDTLFIIEVKYQEVAGSVDEKLQTCDFKRKQYLKLIGSKGIKVEYIYVLNDWFRHPSYKDCLDYIHSVNCHYVFNTIPLKWLGLPNGE